EASCDPPRNARALPRANFSAANTQPLNQLLVTPLVLTPKVVEHLPPLRHQLKQPAARVVVFHVRLEVFLQVVDPLRKQRNLDFWRTGIAGFYGISLDDFRLTRGRNRHRPLTSLSAGATRHAG